MSCYTCNRKAPYRAEVELTENKRLLEAETASSNRKELDVQVEKLISMLKEQYEFKSPSVKVNIYLNEELISSDCKEHVA